MKAWRAGSGVAAGRRRSCPQPFPLATRWRAADESGADDGLIRIVEGGRAVERGEGPSGSENGRYANRNTVLMFPIVTRRTLDVVIRLPDATKNTLRCRHCDDRIAKPSTVDRNPLN